MTIPVAVAIPWRATPDRVEAHDYCLKFWADQGLPVFEADSDPTKPFLCNGARNAAVAACDAEVVVIADADTVPHDILQVRQAIEVAGAGEDVVIYPHTVHRRVPAEFIGTNYLYNAPVIEETIGSPGGIIVASADTFWSLGGFDEHFVPGAWGFDDVAFLYAAETLATVRHIPGIIYAFDHAADRERQEEANPNGARFQLYRLARNQPPIMAALLGLT